MKLDTRLIVPGSAGGTILLAEGGILPSAEIDGDQDEATVVDVTAYLRDVMRLRVPVLETHPRWVGWLSWCRDEPDQERVATDAWIGAWADGRDIDAAAVREAIDDILLVGAAYQVISYDGILAALEPSTRYTLADGATGFLERLEGLIRGPEGARVRRAVAGSFRATRARRTARRPG